MFEKVAEIIAEYKDLDASAITPQTRLVDDLGLDSLDTAELLMSFEDAFGVELTMDSPVATVEELVQRIEKAKG